LPLYDGDLEDEKGIPENALTLKRLFTQHQAFLISSPEYNGLITPLLKNTIDWISRPTPNDKSLIPFTGKIAAIVSASPGALGGLRGLLHLRVLLTNLGVHVIPQQLAVSNADRAFDASGTLQDPRTQSNFQSVLLALHQATEKMHR
jgi:NAD(P)H-dependent FMN reductase